jgi:hypothetical protein
LLYFQKISISLNLSLIGSDESILNKREFRVVEGIMSKFVTMKRVLKNDWQCEGNFNLINGDRTDIYSELINPQRRFMDAPLNFK